jgi:FKBP-type peptidyl-prolyl cis-trans isomerase
MNKSLSLAAAVLLLVVSGCNEQRFIKEKDGTEYKIIRNSSGRPAVAGDFLEVTSLIKYKDSVLYSSAEASAPQFIPYDTAQLPPFFKEIHEGDSLVIRQSTDSIIKHGQGAPFMVKGQFILQGFKIVKLFTSKEAADSAAKPFQAGARTYMYNKAVQSIEKDLTTHDSLTKADDKEIMDYMAKKNLKGSKAKWGTYVVTETPGTGPVLTENDVAVLNYTGRTLNDSAFDSNTDKSFNHVEPLYVDMSSFRVIPGWIDGLRMMQKGTKGKLIVPSYLGYGASGRPPRIGPNQNLVFDIEVTDVVSQEVYQQQQAQKMEQQRQMMEQMQKQMQKQPPQKGK